jgi:serine/threonine protein kinase
MGTVFLASDELLGREVAVKIAHSRFGPGSAAFVDRLRAEARVLARLEHPGIVPVYDAGVMNDGRMFYVMKLVRGRTLAEELAHLPELDRRLSILERVAEAIAFAHERGVVHRDLKPNNIMVGGFGEVLVVDWGVAKLLGAPENLEAANVVDSHSVNTGSGAVIGTPGFMPPEQSDPGIVDRSADVYALGALLAFMATGVSPSAETSAVALLADHKRLSPRLAAIALKCLSAEPAARYASAAEVVEEIRRFRLGGRVNAYRESLVERTWRILKAYRTPILLVLAYLIMRAVVAFLAR